MRPNTTAYRIKVGTSVGDAYLVCVSYPLDSKPTYYGLDFYEISWPSALKASSIPSIRQATFPEELRALHTASCTRDENSGAEVEFIAKQMHSVYGNDARTSVSEINQSMLPYDL